MGGKKGTHRGHTCPRKASLKLCSTREVVSFGPTQRGWAIAFNPSQRGQGGSTIQGVQGGEKSHGTTQHHTHSRPPQTAPQHTNHPHADTPHGTSPGQEPNKTTPGITPRTIPTEAPFQENAIFHPENAHFRIPAKPRAKHTPNATTTPGRCILLERGHPFIPN